MTTITCVEDLRLLAKKRVPKAFYDYADSGSYYEFTEVTTNQINISCTNVQNPAETVEKFLACLVICEEIGTLSYDALGKPMPKINANNRIANNIRNKALVQRGVDSFSTSIDFQYISRQADLDIANELFDRNEDFLVWLCGGRSGSTYFKLKTKPYRLEDLYRVRNISNMGNSFYRNLRISGVTTSLSLVEVDG